MSRSRSLLVLAGLLAAALPAAAAPVINEIMYRPGSTYPEPTGLEFIEIYNPDATAVDLSGWALTTGVDFTFASGTSIAAHGFVVVASNPTTLKTSTGLTTVYGPWTSGMTLANNGEKITLAKPTSSGGWETVDSVTYADEGDWATRTRDTLGGWQWVTPASGSNRSLERYNPNLTKDCGQNWAASAIDGGSPGSQNTRYSTNIAPLITGVKHSPAIPTSSDPVTISATLTDELGATSTALAATLYWRNATTTSVGSFQAVAMKNDGTGKFSATLAALASKQIVEFYVSATDGTNTRTWPAPTNESQNANCTYQVDDEVYTGTAPVYRLILTATENAAFETLAKSNPSSDRQFNVTLVAQHGDDATIRYLCSMRVRGNSSRSYTYKPLHFRLPDDNPWDGVSSFNLNPKASYLQFLAMRLQSAAGLVAADVSPVELRRQGIESTIASGATGDYGLWVRVEDFNSDYLANHFPLAQSAQVYRKTQVTSWNYTTSTAPTDPATLWSGWQKESDKAANDWTDVMNFTKVWQNNAAGHFTGETDGDVGSGTWDKTGFTDAEVTKLATVCDLDYLARWLAVMTVMLDNEPNLSTGEDDDYAGAFISDGTNTRFVALPHDMDTILGTGDGSVSATSVGLYDATETDTVARAGVGNVTYMAPLLPLLGNSANAGNAAFRTKYFTAIRELLGSTFDADTSTNANPPFYQFVDNHLGNWASASVRSSIKSFMTARQTYLLGLIGAAKITPATATSTATKTATSTPTLRLNEILATNTTLPNGATYPDLIELYNAGTTTIDLADKSLTDDPATPRKYVFPSGTTLAAGAYLTISASTAAVSTGLNTGFALDAEGDAVYLYDTTASGGALLDSLVFGFQIPDHSLSRTGTTAATWALTPPTFGTANASPATLGSPGDLKINEWAGNISFRVDHDFLELYNPAATPIALAGVRLTDDVTNYPSRFVFPALSFIAPTGFLPLYGADLTFGLDGDFDVLSLLGENAAVIDTVDFVAQPADHSTGRTTDGGTATADFAVPTPGLSNTATLPAAYSALLSNLRISEIMYEPTAASSPGDYEFIELQNIGGAPLDLSGVRFTNGLDYTFPSGTTLAAGAYLVVCKNRTAFLARYAYAADRLAAGQFSGALDNSGETIALTLPAPWYVHILSFRYESSWYATTAGGGCSLVARTPATTPARDWGDKSTWQASSSVYGSPGYADGSTFTVSLGQSTSVTTTVGGNTLLSVSVASTGTVTYQWQKLVDGQWVDLAGATSAAYLIGGTQTSAAGSYRAVVTVNGLAVTSAVVTLTVVTADQAAIRLVNLSTRAQSLTGDSIVIPGFVLAGTGSKQVVLRAVGPSLANYGVTAFLADPQFTLKRYNSTTAAWTDLATNDNWETNANLAALVSTQAAVGAVGFASGTKDSALLLNLTPGLYSAPTTGVNNGTGIVIMELFDADSAATATCHLSNLSTRGYVGTGEDVMIAGFVLDGVGTRQVLIRALGPTLASYGVAGALADPQLTVYHNGDTLGTNDDWSGSAEIANAATLVGASSLASTSKDAALLLTLPAGSYTVHVSGVSGATGAASVEIFDVP